MLVAPTSTTPNSSGRPGGLRGGVALAVGLAVTAALPLATAGTASAADTGLVVKLTSVMKDSRVQRAASGAVVLDAGTGEVLYNRYGTRSLMPASNTKIVTAVAAMHTLGPGYRFRTQVVRRAGVVRGVVRGRLYLKGYGDPTTRQSDYASLAHQVRAAGIREVTGRLIVDSTFFDSQRYNPGWSAAYADQYYAAETSALTVAPDADYDSGTVILNYAPGARGRHAKITTTPAAAASYLRIANRTTTTARDTTSTFAASRTLSSNTITVTGRVAQGTATGHWLITVHDPQLYAGAVFRAELAKVGVKVRGRTQAGELPATSRHTLATDTSMPLSSLLVPFLKLSNNLHAEALTKTMGTLRGHRGNWADGLGYTRAYLRHLGVSMAGVSLTDGSGVTRRNRLTPLALATVLQRVQREPWFAQFYAALPVAGDPSRMSGGTLRHRMTGTAAAYNAHAKTGSLTGVTALSGYVTGRDGHRYAFSMLSTYTGTSPRPVENTLVVTLANWTRTP